MSLPLEHRLLLALLNPGTPRPPADLHRGADWDTIARVAEGQGLLPLLSSASARWSVDLPAAAKARTRHAGLLAQALAIASERVLATVGASFDAAGLPFLVLKGVPLARELYGDPGLRPAGDVDLLVRRRDRLEALHLLEALGYRPSPGSFSVGFYLRHHFHISMAIPGSEGLPVELHWDTQPPFSLSIIPEAEIWRRARRVEAGATRVLAPGREENFLYLLQHLSRHVLGVERVETRDPVASFRDPALQGRLIWLADLVRLARGGTALDELLLDRLAADWGLDRELDAVQTLIARVERAPLEEDAGAPAAPAARRRAAWLARHWHAAQFRPILALHAGRYLFPGGAWLRRRYALRGASAARVLAAAIGHAGAGVSRLTRMGLAIGRESLRKDRAVATPAAAGDLTREAAPLPAPAISGARRAIPGPSPES